MKASSISMHNKPKNLKLISFHSEYSLNMNIKISRVTFSGNDHFNLTCLRMRERRFINNLKNSSFSDHHQWRFIQSSILPFIFTHPSSHSHISSTTLLLLLLACWFLVWIKLHSQQCVRVPSTSWMDGFLIELIRIYFHTSYSSSYSCRHYWRCSFCEVLWSPSTFKQ